MSWGVRARKEINGTCIHLIFRPSLADLQSRNPQNSTTIPPVSLNQIDPIWPKSQRLHVPLISLRTLTEEEFRGRCSHVFDSADLAPAQTRGSLSPELVEGTKGSDNVRLLPEFDCTAWAPQRGTKWEKLKILAFYWSEGKLFGTIGRMFVCDRQEKR